MMIHISPRMGQKPRFASIYFVSDIISLVLSFISPYMMFSPIGEIILFSETNVKTFSLDLVFLPSGETSRLAGGHAL